MVTNSNGRRNTTWLFTSVAKKLNAGHRKQHQVVVRRGLEPATSGLQVWHSNHLATLPPCYGITKFKKLLTEV